jgi:hypothetical protein
MNLGLDHPRLDGTTVGPKGNGTSVPLILGVHVLQEGTPGADVKFGSNPELQTATNVLVKKPHGNTTERGAQQSSRGDNSLTVC